MRVSLAFASLSLIIGSAAAPAYAASDEMLDQPAANAAAAGQIEDFDAKCAADAEARARRQVQRSLFQRLGEEPGIRSLIDELLRLHYKNDALYGVLKNYAPAVLAEKLAPYVIESTGGPSVYRGGPLPDSHRNLGITDQMFASGGGDLVEAMKVRGYGPEETQDLLCLIFSLRRQVVFPDKG